jgi:hypothetical protein
MMNHPNDDGGCTGTPECCSPHEHTSMVPRRYVLLHVRDEHRYPGPDSPATTVHEREQNQLAYHRAWHLAHRA